MQTITLKVKDRAVFTHFLQILEELEGIEIEQIRDNEENQESSFFSLAGMWENKEITTEEIRAKAWKKK